MSIFASRLTSLNTKEVRRYARGEKLSEEFIDDIVLEAIALVNPKGSFKIFDYDSKNAIIFSDDKKIQLEGKSIKKHLTNCEKVAVLALTVGEDIEKTVSKMSEEGEYARALLLDAAATEAVEEAADAMEKVIDANAKREGFFLTFRFSPGYGDFPIEMQSEILKLSGGQEIGISLTSSLMLIPRKSITAIIGFKKGSCVFLENKCYDCKNINCAYRKV